MSRNAIIAVTIGAIIILGAVAAFLYSQTSKSTKEQTPVAVEATVTPANGMTLESIADIFSSSKTSKCSFTSSDENGTVDGTVYVSGENARSDIDTTVNGKTESTHMIRNGDTFFMWGDSLPTGMKMVMNIKDWASKFQGAQPTGTPESFDPNKAVDFKCSSWTVDSSMFTAPTSVKFITIQGATNPTGAMTSEGATPATTENGTQDKCSICNALTGDAKNVCLQQFNCQ